MTGLHRLWAISLAVALSLQLRLGYAFAYNRTSFPGFGLSPNIGPKMRVSIQVGDCGRRELDTIQDAYMGTLDVIEAARRRLAALEPIIKSKPSGNSMMAGIERSTMYTYETLFGTIYRGRTADNSQVFNRLDYVLGEAINPALEPLSSVRFNELTIAIDIYRKLEDGFRGHPIELWCHDRYLTKEFPPEFFFPINYPDNKREETYWDSRPENRWGQRARYRPSRCTGSILASPTPDETGERPFDLLKVCPPWFENRWFAEASLFNIRGQRWGRREKHLNEYWAHLSVVLTHEITHSHIILGYKATQDIVGQRSAYGYQEANYHATTNPEMAIRNADNYALFALAMYLDAYDWSLGANDPMYDDGPMNAPID
ncbi:hypothetical protein FQN49_004881 [Arthroderma sp. PD_2]|nr:hypothetical protein FQN49_004881 [Arthroderma sp. PD_2]